jgi:hypothetical protein
MTTVVTPSRRHRHLPTMLTVLFAAVLIVIPVGATGAYWTTTVTGAAGTAGTGAWCATPDTAGTNSRFIRLSSITTDVSGALGPFNRKMAIIPVANNAAWGGNGTTARTLSVRLYNCQEAPDPALGLRVMSWSNPTGSASLNRTWITGGTVAPASRLNPNVAGLGVQLRDKAQAADARQDSLLGLGSSDLRRFSWIIANHRTRTAPALNPPTCGNTLGISSCSVPLTAVGGGENLVKDLVDVTPWDTPGEFVTYVADTFANQAPTGWNSSDLNCVFTGLTCNSVATATRLNATAATDTTLYGSTDGNQLQWLIIQYTGTAPADLVLEVVLG